MLGSGEMVENLHLHQQDPFFLEHHRQQNLLKEKENELISAHGEIKALKATEVLKTKALEELESEVLKLESKLLSSENVVEQKNLEIIKLAEERKEALAAQFAAEATLRRVYADQKDDDPFPFESIIAPLESELKMYKNEVNSLMEDNKALERLTKSKESALIETEKILRSALERTLIVEEIQNHNLELKRQIEICQEENKILEKNNRQKVVEVEKLSQTINELEEAILAGSAAANAEEKKTLERELARAKVSANRVATAVANEWKDENDKVMPIKIWLEERRLMQAEIQRLKDKLSVAERAAKAEAQLKDKLKLRLKTLEEGLKQVPKSSQSDVNSSIKPSKTNLLGFLSNNAGLKKRSSSLPRSASIRGSSPSRQVNEQSRQNGSFVENKLRKGFWASKGKIVDSNEKEDVNMISERKAVSKEGTAENEDVVSGFLYDKLQKEVLGLRKVCEAKDGNLNAKDEEIKMLMKKLDTLTKSIEVQNKKSKKDKAGVSCKVDGQKSNRNVGRITTAA
ncbi:hypothetical protein V2J09_003266 [Rumex salicifolius]